MNLATPGGFSLPVVASSGQGKIVERLDKLVLGASEHYSLGPPHFNCLQCVRMRRVEVMMDGAVTNPSRSPLPLVNRSVTDLEIDLLIAYGGSLYFDAIKSVEVGQVSEIDGKKVVENVEIHLLPVGTSGSASPSGAREWPPVLAAKDPFRSRG